MSNQSSSASGGIGMGGALFLLFLGLKLTGHIDWSWWWVFAPIWIPLAFIIFVLIVIAFFAWLAGNRHYKVRINR